MKIIILGGGPCGLGAAWRLSDIGHENWHLYEKQSHVGGLATSYIDDEGFCWDVGGHVLFSHYKYFDNVMDTIWEDKNKEWLFHEREAWIRMQNRYVPYPFQNNIHKLPKEIFLECLNGIIDIYKNFNKNAAITNFGEWIDASFGKGIAKWFLRPYNYKVWAYPVEDLDNSWVGERVAIADLSKIIENYVYSKDDISWGPNSKFRFPRYGGTGAIWNKMAEHLPSNKISTNYNVKNIDVNEKKIIFENNETENYDILLNTIPLTNLVRKTNLKSNTIMLLPLKHSSSHIIGIALKGNTPEHLATKCWIYFPENNCPFYRVTVFSNYSPNNVPDIKSQWSIMCEVSESKIKKVNPETIIEEVIQGALNTKLIENRNSIHHTWYKKFEKGYPTPSKDRNKLLFPVINQTQKHDIYSRGRFGGWKYEVGNMDHSFMQGVEFVNHLLYGAEEMTYWYPNIVNTNHPSGEKIR